MVWLYKQCRNFYATIGKASSAFIADEALPCLSRSRNTRCMTIRGLVCSSCSVAPSASDINKTSPLTVGGLVLSPLVGDPVFYPFLLRIVVAYHRLGLGIGFFHLCENVVHRPHLLGQLRPDILGSF